MKQSPKVTSAGDNFSQVTTLAGTYTKELSMAGNGKKTADTAVEALETKTCQVEEMVIQNFLLAS